MLNAPSQATESFTLLSAFEVQVKKDLINALFVKGVEVTVNAREYLP